MPRLRISDAPLLNSVIGDEKIPTGKYGDYTLTPDMIVVYAQGKLPFATKTELAQVKAQLEASINTVQTTLSAEISTLSTKVDSMESQVLGVSQDLTLHKSDVSNPHKVTKEQVGLGNVDNTSDLNKPISTATQAALNQKISSVNGKSGNSITLTREDLGIPTDEQIKSFTKESKYILDESGLTQQKINKLFPHVSMYGAVGDGSSHPLSERYSTLALAQAVYPFVTSLTQEIDLCATKKMLNENVGKLCSVDNTKLYFGTINEKTSAVKIIGHVGTEISGNCTITAINNGRNCVVFGVVDPIRFKSHGIHFFDPTYDRETNIGGMRKGIVGFSFASENYNVDNKCGNIEISGTANQVLAHIIIDGANQTNVASSQNFYAMDRIKVRTKVTNSYYAITDMYGCTNGEFDIQTIDVRRALIGYGQKHFKANVWAKNTDGFLGSNAFVELACEGEATTNPKTQTEVNIEPEDFEITVHVSGVEAHEGIVHFYHQNELTPSAKIRNGKATIFLNNLTTVGKNPTAGLFNAFVFSHETSTKLQATTDRMIDNVSLDLMQTGSISGSPFYIKSRPNNKLGTIRYGAGLCRQFPKTTISIAYFTDFQVIEGLITIPQNIRLYGTTIAGVMTTTKSNCSLIIDGLTSKYEFNVAWSAFTGTGNLRADGLSLATTQSGSTISSCGIDSGFSGVLSASLEGNLSVVYFYLKNLSDGTLGIAPCNPTGEIRMTLQFPYK